MKGHKKGANYDIGEAFSSGPSTGHWNAVLIDDQWRLLDTNWASRCLGNTTTMEDTEIDDQEEERPFLINEFFFLTDPDELIFSHWAEMTEWQLLKNPLTIETFQSKAYLKSHFFNYKLELMNLNLEKCVLRAEGGERKVGMKCPSHNSLKFKYSLQKRKERRYDPNTKMNRHVLYQRKGDTVTYFVTSPSNGYYCLNIYASDKESQNVNHVCSYLIYCDVPKKDLRPLPDAPEDGWGLTQDGAQMGITLKSHQNVSVDVMHGNLELQFALQKRLNVLHKLFHSNIDPLTLQTNVLIRLENMTLIVEVRLPRRGLYALKLFANDINKIGELPNVCNYVLNCTSDSSTVRIYPRFQDGIVGRSYYAAGLNVNEVSYKHISEGVVELVFTVPANIELLCELTHNIQHLQKTCDDVSRSGSGETVIFVITMTTPGDYGLTIYGRQVIDEDRVYHVHTYTIQYKPHLATPAKKLRNPPKGPATEKHTVYTGSVNIHVPDHQKPLVMASLRRNTIETPEDGQIKLKKNMKGETCTVKLSKPGEHNVTLFTVIQNGALLHHLSVRILFLTKVRQKPH